MNSILIEPTDVLFFRDGIPMSAGQGKGAGCRLPFPSTLHEALRSSLLLNRAETPSGKTIPGRPRGAERKGNWHEQSYKTDVRIASKAFRSLRTVGPLPVQGEKLLLSVPLDVVRGKGGRLSRFKLLQCGAGSSSGLFPASVEPPDKNGALHGWWTVEQYGRYLQGKTAGDFDPIPASDLWESEHRIGVEIDPSSFSSVHGQLYSASMMRPGDDTRFYADWSIPEGRDSAQETEEVKKLDWLLFGGERRLARLQNGCDLLEPLRTAPDFGGKNEPCLLKWVLVTPAIFFNGSLPGWCRDTKKDRDGGLFPAGRVCFDLGGKADLIAQCLGKPRPVSGWDVAEDKPKATQLAVPEGSVYYFLCENSRTANELAKKLHWQPRSDFYGEKGCGYGLVSTDAKLHPTSGTIQELAQQIWG